MKVGQQSYRAVWMYRDQLYMIDQRLLPFRFDIVRSDHFKNTCEKIKDMTVRGAGTIGATAGFAMAQAFLNIPSEMVETGERINFLREARKEIEKTRPTARDLFYAVNRVFTQGIESLGSSALTFVRQMVCGEALRIADEYVDAAERIGIHGKDIIHDHFNILTHCNAGWLALVDHGSALSPLFRAHSEGRKFHVWVDETRPRVQGGRLTAWELQQEGIPHTIIADNAAGLLMLKGQVDMVITGADRIARNGDVANKIGTLEKAVLAKEFNIPFYVAAPLSTFDKDCPAGDSIVIEERSGDEVNRVQGISEDNQLMDIRITNPGSDAYNPAFDITPAKYVTAYLTEKGVFEETSALFL